MRRRFQNKWNVSTVRLVLILCTFAVGGSLTGYLGRKVLMLVMSPASWFYWPLYILLVTLLWPLTVLIVSIPFGQVGFFRSYLARIARRLSGGSDSMKRNIKAHAPVRIAIFASGAGSNAQKIFEYFAGHSRIEIGLVVCNKPTAGVIQRAEQAGIPVLHIGRDRFTGGDAYVPELKKAGIDWIVLAGFLWKIPDLLIAAYPRKIVNIHPALLPEFGGKGMYGNFVHEAVLTAGRSQSGITIHFVDEHYDHGDVIFQTACPVLPNDTPETLAHRIHALEHAHFAPVIDELISSTPS